MNLKEYIDQNRDILDAETPDQLMIWEGIRSRLGRRKQRRLVVVSAAVAAVVTVFLVYLPALLNRLGDQPAEPVLPGAYGLQQTGYIQQINMLEMKLEAIGIPGPEWPNRRELKYTDDLIRLYTNDLNQNGPNQELINTLLDLHRKKILLLERISIELQNPNHHEMAQTTL